MSDGDRSARRSVRTAVVWDALAGVPGLVDGDPARLVVVDLGGGTGGFAVPLAARGHEVVVVDASADALAVLARRAGERGVAVRGLQGDAADLPALVGTERADLVLCHNVLEYVDDPAAALAAVRDVLRPGGTVSVLVPNRVAAVLHRAVGGHVAEAARALTDPRGRWGDDDPVPRRLDLDELTALVAAAGLVPGASHGVRILADLVPGAASGTERGTGDTLLALERAAAARPELRAVATQLHLLAGRRG